MASLEQDLKHTKKVYSNAYTKLIMRVKKLEHKFKSRQPRRRPRVVISDTEDDLEDPFKQGRRIAEIDQNPSISLVQDEGTSWIQEDFNYSDVKSASTPTDLEKPLVKDADADDVDEHLYRSMIGSLMYLTASRLDIMFAVCACASDYAGATQDRKSTTRGCQFLGNRLISWQCKKQTVVSTSTTEVEYVAAAN
ncbi:hypothetical protein Tco_0555634 [Tanacetum coccineum]